MSTCIAVIDDDAACREPLHDLLSEEGYAVRLQHLARGAPGISCRHGCRETRARLCGRLAAVGAPAPGTPCGGKPRPG